jgi:hypothetical protein
MFIIAIHLQLSLPLHDYPSTSLSHNRSFAHSSCLGYFLPSTLQIRLNVGSTLFLSRQRHRARLDHERHDLVENIGSSHLARSELLACDHRDTPRLHDLQ